LKRVSFFDTNFCFKDNKPQQLNSTMRLEPRARIAQLSQELK
jgi:hypothetical protein